MGLGSGPHGIKRYLTDRYSSSVQRHSSLEKLVDSHGHADSNTALVVDGNSMLMSIPLCFKRYEDMVDHLVFRIRTMMRSARTIIICFDTPQYVPKTKSLAHKQRDAAEKVSTETNACKFDDDAFTTETLERFEDCHLVLRCRATNPDAPYAHKYRMLDLLMVSTMERFRKSIQEGASLLVVEGIDPDVLERAPFTERKPKLMISDQMGLAHVGLSIDPHSGACTETKGIGEGDLKTQAIVQSLIRASNTYPHNLILISSTDVDIVPITLLSTETRWKTSLANEQRSSTLPKVFVVLRERGQYAKRALEGSSTSNGFAGAGILAFDVQHLASEITQREPLGSTLSTNAPIPQSPELVLRALCATWAMNKCDFVAIDLSAGDMLTDVLLDLLRDPQATLGAQLASLVNQDERALDALPAFRTILKETARRLPKRRALHTKIKQLCDETCPQLTQSIWTMLYWASCDLSVPDKERFGFEPDASVSQTNVAASANTS